MKQALTTLGQEYQGTDLGIVAISANDAAAYAQDAPASLKAMAAAESFTFPLCYDETQSMAKAYTAACTPDFFLFDQQRKLVYRGQLDASRPGNQIPVTGKDLRAAIEAILADQPINPAQKASLGCNIKWKQGNEPPYFLSPSNSTMRSTFCQLLSRLLQPARRPWLPGSRWPFRLFPKCHPPFVQV